VSKLYSDYVFGKQTLAQLSEQNMVSTRTIQRRLNSFKSAYLVATCRHVIVLMDATYWGWNFGVVAMKDSRTKQILWRKFLCKKETLADYQEGMNWLVANSFQIEGVVCDGLRGMFSLFSVYKVQMCQFHQVQIVKRYLTQRPKLEASKELLEIVRLLCKTDRESFEGAINEWCEKWSVFLRERCVDKDTGKSHYVHRRTRSAYLSIKRNMSHLWTWYDHLEVGIPNTNNGLEGKFTDLKSKLRNHNGLSKEHRKIFIDEYFRGKF
jgi:hypothetical protein